MNIQQICRQGNTTERSQSLDQDVRKSHCPVIIHGDGDFDMQNSYALQRSHSMAAFTKIRPQSHYNARAPESKVVIRFKRPTFGRPQSATLCKPKRGIYSTQNSLSKTQGIIKYRNQFTDSIKQFPLNLNKITNQPIQEADFSRLHQTIYNIHVQSSRIEEENIASVTQGQFNSKYSVAELKKIINKDQRTLAKSASTPQMQYLIAKDDHLPQKENRKPRPNEIYQVKKMDEQAKMARTHRLFEKQITTLSDMYDEDDPQLQVINKIISPSQQRKNSIVNSLQERFGNNQTLNQQVNIQISEYQSGSKTQRLSSAEPRYSQQSDGGTQTFQENTSIQYQQPPQIGTYGYNKIINPDNPKPFIIHDGFKGRPIPSSQVKYHVNSKEQQSQRNRNFQVKSISYISKEFMRHKAQIDDLLQHNKLIPTKSKDVEIQNVNIFDSETAINSPLNKNPISRNGEDQIQQQLSIDANLKTQQPISNISTPQIEQNPIQQDKVEIYSKSQYYKIQQQISSMQQSQLQQNYHKIQGNSDTIRSDQQQHSGVSTKQSLNRDIQSVTKPKAYEYPVSLQKSKHHVTYLAEKFPKFGRKRPISASQNTRTFIMKKSTSMQQLIYQGQNDMSQTERSGFEPQKVKTLLKNSFIQQRMKKNSSQASLKTQRVFDSSLIKTSGNKQSENIDIFEMSGDQSQKEKQKQISEYLQRIAKLSRAYDEHFQRKPVYKILKNYASPTRSQKQLDSQKSSIVDTN